MGLVNGAVLRLAKGGGGGRKHKALHAAGAHHVEQLQGVEQVVLVVARGLLHGFTHLDEGGKVHDSVKAASVHHRLKQGPVGQAAFDELSLAHGVGVAA